MEDLKELLIEGEGECVEFKIKYTKDKVGRTICSFANTKGGKIAIGVSDKKEVVGVEDPNEVVSQVQDLANGCDPSVQIKVTSINSNNGRTVVVVEVSKSQSTHIHRYNKQAYKRVGEKDKPISSAELTSLMKERSSFDEDICYAFKYDEHFDKEKVLKVFKKEDYASSLMKTGWGNNWGNDWGGSGKKYATSLMVSVGAAVRTNGDVVFRNVGVLFFAKDLSVFYPHASIHCLRFSGIDETDKIVAKKQFNEDLFSDVENALAFLKEHLNMEYRFPHDSPRREEILEIPPEALREAVVNAVTHRDYRERGAHTTIKVFDNRVEISNPCIYKETGINSMGDSRRINPVVADFMHRAGYVEKAGTGLKKIQKLTKDAGRPASIDIHNFHWKLIFPRREYGKKIFSTDVKYNFDDRSLTSKRADRLSSLLNLIAIRKFEKSSFAKDRAISHRTVEEDLKYLKNARLITFEGTKQTGGYLVTEEYGRWQQNFNMEKFQLPEFACHPWDLGKEVAEYFLKYADKEKSHKKEVTLLKCLRGVVSSLSQRLYGDTLQERTNIKGMPLGVSFASTPEKERKLFQYLKQLASNIEAEEYNYDKDE